MSRQLATPSPSPPPPIPTPTLPAQINAATRKQHTELNCLIVDRLPLALPPKASNPALLSRGISAFAAIFFHFETCWAELYDSVEADDTSLTGTHDAQLRRWLATLRPPELSRTSRLLDDLDFISNRAGRDVRPWFTLDSVILYDIREKIRAKPHILIAYGWVMYMAIFSGGRWIRQQLSNAGVEFWTGNDPGMEFNKEELPLLDIPGFSFLSFDGDEDGEDIKALFKGRLAEAETLLTHQERQDVVEAAEELFGMCCRLVSLLDCVVWWDRVGMKISIALLTILVAAWALLHYR